VDGSAAGPTGSERERARRIAKDWITRLVDRTPLDRLGELPLDRLGAEAAPLIVTVLEALDDPDRGPGELAGTADRLAELFGEGRRPATADEVTGLPGPDELAKRLRALLAEQRRYGHPFSIALVDVDGLARINEAYGHEGGDRMLAAVAAILRRELRDVDEAFRVEDDEFAIVAPHADAPGLVPMATRVANLIADSQSPDGPRIAIAAGIAGCPADGLSAERLIESATEAVYAAKASGAAVARSPNESDAVLQDP
jgi:diguanylate cyclase (GGDEF)-like protein